MARIGDAEYSARVWFLPSIPGRKKLGAGDPMARVGCSVWVNRICAHRKNAATRGQNIGWLISCQFRLSLFKDTEWQKRRLRAAAGQTPTPQVCPLTGRQTTKDDRCRTRKKKRGFDRMNKPCD